eukprot:6756817-Alexandrium_andersonii.AAC.1
MQYADLHFHHAEPNPVGLASCLCTQADGGGDTGQRACTKHQSKGQGGKAPARIRNARSHPPSADPEANNPQSGRPLQT